MEQRVKALEETMASLRQDVAIVRSNYATREDLASVRTEMQGLRADLHKSLNEQTWKVIGAAALLAAAVYAFAKYVH